jgi:hypothetical protein
VYVQQVKFGVAELSCIWSRRALRAPLTRRQRRALPCEARPPPAGPCCRRTAQIDQTVHVVQPVNVMLWTPRPGALAAEQRIWGLRAAYRNR